MMRKEKFVLNNCESIELPVVTMSNGITIRLYDPYDTTTAHRVIGQLNPIIQKWKDEGFETIVVPATKPVPLAWHLAVQHNMNLVVLKKEIKPYHEPCMDFNCKSITSNTINSMFITKTDFNNLHNLKVIFFDDVLSSGATYEACKDFLLNKCYVEDLKSLFVFKEGTSYKEGNEVTYLGSLPI